MEIIYRGFNSKEYVHICVYCSIIHNNEKMDQA